MQKRLAEWPLRPAEIRDGLAQNVRARKAMESCREIYQMHAAGRSWAEIGEIIGSTRSVAQRSGAMYKSWLDDQSELKTLSPRSRAALENGGITNRASVEASSLPDILRISALGRKSAYEIVLWATGKVPDWLTP